MEEDASLEELEDTLRPMCQAGGAQAYGCCESGALDEHRARVQAQYAGTYGRDGDDEDEEEDEEEEEEEELRLLFRG